MNANEKASLRSLYKAGHPDSFGHAHVEEAVLAHELGVAQAELDVAREWLKRHMRRMDEMQTEASKLRVKKQRLIVQAQSLLPASAVVGLSISMDELSEKVRREHVKKLTTPDATSAATQVVATPVAATQPAASPAKTKKKPAAPPDRIAAAPEPQIPQPDYAGPFKTWPEIDAPRIELDRKEIDTLHSAYSADTIAERGSKTRRPVKIGNTMYISTGGMSGGPSGRSSEDGYEFVPVADYPLPTHHYSIGAWKGYEGMIVSVLGQECVLTRPVRFWHQDPPKIVAPPIASQVPTDSQMRLLEGDPVIDDVDSLAEEAIYADTREN